MKVHATEARTLLQGKKIWVGIAGIGVELLCVAALALKAPTAVWVAALLIGAFLVVLAFVVGEPDKDTLDVVGQRAESGAGEGHVRGVVFGDNATVTIGEGAKVTSDLPKKSFVRVSAGELTNIYKEHTAIQAEKLVEPYINGWLRVTGGVSDVTKVVWGDGYRVVVEVDEDLVFATFLQESQEQLPRLRRGEKITVVGKLAKVEAYAVELEESELLESDL